MELCSLTNCQSRNEADSWMRNWAFLQLPMQSVQGVHLVHRARKELRSGWRREECLSQVARSFTSLTLGGVTDVIVFSGRLAPRPLLTITATAAYFATTTSTTLRLQHITTVPHNVPAPRYYCHYFSALRGGAGVLPGPRGPPCRVGKRGEIST